MVEEKKHQISWLNVLKCLHNDFDNNTQVEF